MTWKTELNDYLRKILTARVYDVAVESPLEPAPALSRRTGNAVLLKREDLQSVFSFKLRGAYNKMAHCTPAQLAAGVIAASAGNHAQGVALAAAKLGCRATNVMPTTTPMVKIDAVKIHGGRFVRVVLHGDSFADAQDKAVELQKRQGLTYIHPFDDPYVIAGQGTVGMEILRQHPGSLQAVFVAIGGGGLAAGVAAYIKQVRPEIKVIGVQTHDSDAMMRSVLAGHRVSVAEVGLFADGTAVKTVGRHTFKLCRRLIDDFVAVGTDEVCAAIKDVFLDTRTVTEPSGALAVAGLKAYVQRHKLSGQTLAAITCGANMNFDRLRFIAERTQVGEAREALFAVTIPEERGSFRRFCALLGKRNVTEFNYRIGDAVQARVFVGVGIAEASENETLARLFRKHGYSTTDLSRNTLAAEHVRYMVGGRSSLAADERVYSFDFPERPGALTTFLASMAPAWNISMFHYRNQGSAHSRVLVGLQVPEHDRQAFAGFLRKLGYAHKEETHNPAYALFLGS